MTVLPSGLQLTWDGAAGRSPGLPGWPRSGLAGLCELRVGWLAAEFDLAGFAQGAGLIFISANDYHRSIFTVELKSGHIIKTGKTRNSGKIFPLISFCTPGTS